MIKGERFNHEVKPPDNLHEADNPGRPNLNQKPMFKRIWRKIKSTTLNQVAPFILDNLDFDFDVDKDSGKDYVTIKVTVTFQGRTIFMRQKTIQL